MAHICVETDVEDEDGEQLRLALGVLQCELAASEVQTFTVKLRGQTAGSGSV